MALPISFKSLVKDIRFWILLCFILRLYGITNPPLEAAHNWRQVTVTMAARNFYETDPNILYPRIDASGEKSGITGMEFPLLNYLIFLVSKIFGYAHWYGRPINLVVSSLGVFWFYRLIKRFFTQELAFSSSLLLLFSIWFAYSRKIMPDTFAMSLCILGLDYGLRYLYGKPGKKWALLGGYFLFTCLGILSKLPVCFFVPVLLIPFMNKNIRTSSKALFSLISIPIAILVWVYYFYWVPYLQKTYGLDHFFMGKSLYQGFVESVEFKKEVAEKFYLDAMHFIGFGFFVLGVGMMLWKRNVGLGLIFLLCSLGYTVIVFKSGVTFARHSYYIVPFVPVMCLMAAYAIQQIPAQLWRTLMLAAICIENVANWQHDFYVPADRLAFMELEKDLDKLGPRTDLILVNSDVLPTPLYCAHRKGWTYWNEFITKPSNMDSLQNLGLKWIVIAKDGFGSPIQLTSQKMLDNPHYTIYKAGKD